MAFTPQTLILATGNLHKIQEIRAILGEGIRYLSARNFPGHPALLEDANTFAGNSTRKALGLAAWLSSSPPGSPLLETSGGFVLADDSGLEVDALGGAPGVHSARFAAMDPGTAANSNDTDNNRKLLRLLMGVPLTQRTARFRCVLALVALDATGSPGAPELFEGVCEGRIDFAPRGNGGFGYDPLFIPAGLEVSFAELGESVKNQLSHRARALKNLREHFEF